MSNKEQTEDVPLFINKKIINRKKLSESFGIICEKITVDDNANYVLKKYNEKKTNFNAIISEGKSLKYMYSRFPNIFPRTYFLSNNLIIMDYIEHDDVKDSNYEKKLASLITKIHMVKNDKYGFDFDTAIGGLRQPSEFSNNWVDFFKEKRLGMIFELINNHHPMPLEINIKLEKIINELDNYLPKNPKPSLIHGDLWEGNILFNKGKISGLIDPGIYFAHNEMEIAYLTWFEYIGKNFLNYYSEIIKLDKNYYKYEPIYQLYYCLLNVYLWSRDYIHNTKELIDKLKT